MTKSMRRSFSPAQWDVIKRLMAKAEALVVPKPPEGQCGFCGQEALGYASADLWSWEDVRLCHDEERDCYHIVTVWGGDKEAYDRAVRRDAGTSE